MSQASQSQGSLLDDRYGRSRKRSLDRRVAWIAAAVLVLAGIGFLFFSGWQQGTGVDARSLSYTVIDDRTVSVDALVTIPVGNEAVCAFEALSESYATVGWKLVELPAVSEPNRQFTVEIVTTSPATTGSVRECWVVEK